MQRKVIEIVEKYLAEGWDDHEEEILYLGPWTVLVGYPIEDQTLIRKMAREIVETIRGVDQADLVTVPSEDDAKMWLHDNMPISTGLDDPNERDAQIWVEHAAGSMLKWLRAIHTSQFWRGKRIEGKRRSY